MFQNLIQNNLTHLSKSRVDLNKTSKIDKELVSNQSIKRTSNNENWLFNAKTTRASSKVVIDLSIFEKRMASNHLKTSRAESSNHSNKHTDCTIGEEGLQDLPINHM